MKSFMPAMHNFAVVPQANIPRSQFNRSHGLKTAFNTGYLIPIFVDEALPGDTFNLQLSTFGRLSTLVVPVMDNIRVDYFFFAVPKRLVWNNFQKFMGEQEDPGDSTDFLIPQITVNTGSGVQNETIYDYMGIPTKVDDFSFSALPLRAYNLIWNEWFRDENLQNSVTVNKGDGPDLLGDYSLLYRGKRHDYFTSCLPWPQKGDAVTLPLGTTASIKYDTISGTNIDGQFAQVNVNGSSIYQFYKNTTQGTLGTSVSASSAHDLYVDLTNATAATINQLREAFSVQRLYERDARGGTRYTEIVRSHFGVISPDARLQRPEYLGGGSSYINIHPIAQTSASNGTDTPQGNLSAMATTAANGIGFVKSFTEHSIVLGLAQVTVDLSYQQGLDRMWSRRTKLDLYWPELAHLGEQAVLNKEIFVSGVSATDDAVFGYIPRYDEYRYKQSKITGKMRSNDTTSLDIWHLAQDFTGTPLLNGTFIQDIPPIDRVLAVTTEPAIIMDCYFTYKCARPMPTYSVPGLGGKF